MPTLMDIPIEVFELVFLHLDNWKDLVSLGSTCSALQMIFIKPTLWQKLLEKTRMVSLAEIEESRGEMVMKFPSMVVVPEHLLALLQDTICNEDIKWKEKRENEKYDANVVIVSSTRHSELHPVSGLGLMLLYMTEQEGDKHRIHEAHLRRTTESSLLLSLGAVALRQEEQILKLEVYGDISCLNEEQERSLCSLLGKSATWRVYMLILEKGLGWQFWSDLGRAAERGNLRILYTKRISANKKEDILAVKNITEVFWLMNEDEGDWRMIEASHIV